MGAEYSGIQRSEVKSSQKIAGFNPKQIEMIKEKFILMCDDDLGIDIAKFQQLIKMKDADAKVVFQLFDIDNSGRIDSYEFICGLAIQSHTTLEEKAEAIFKLYDFDNSQVLSIDEMVVLFRCVICSLSAMTGRKNTPNIQEVERIVEGVMAKHDNNKDKQISIDEFKSIITKDRNIVACLKNFGLIHQEDLRQDFGGGEDDIPECDSDLENEVEKVKNNKRSKGFNLRRQGIEFRGGKDEKSGKYLKDKILDNNNGNLKHKEWYETASNSQPSSYKMEKGEDTVPDSYLQLDYIHGYRCHDTRNNIRYAPNGELVYHTASVAVVLDKKSNTQRFFFEHTDDITCQTSYDTQVATGQLGKKPLIHVWDSKNIVSKCVISGLLKDGISQLCFSNNGKKLAASCMNSNQTIAVYDMPKLMSSKHSNKLDCLSYSGKGPKEPILDMKFDNSDNVLVIGCVKAIYFATLDNSKIKLKKGHGWGKIPMQSIMCIAFQDSNILTGSFSGKLLSWKSSSLISSYEAHTSALTTIWVRKNNKGFVTGGNDGVVVIWDGALNKITSIDIKNLGEQINLMSTKIRAVCEDLTGTIAIGTRGGEILEAKTDGMMNLVNRGHYNKKVCGLAPHPFQNEFVTFGQDSLFVIWSVETKKAKGIIKMSYGGNCLCFSPDGKTIAFGCENGYVIIMETINHTVIKTLKDRHSPVNCLKFNTDGTYLSVGAEDTEIITYNVSQNYKFISRARAHSYPVTHLDYSTDGKSFQSMSSNGDWIFFHADTGKKINGGGLLFRDETWNSWSLPIGWPTIGIWPPYSNGFGDINTVDRNPEKNQLASGDDYGKIKLFKYPSPIGNSSYVRYVGHSAHVTNVKFSHKGDYLFSVGGDDKSVFQWKVYSQKDIDYQDKDDEEEQELINKNFDELMIKDIDNLLFEEQKVETGDEMMANKPYIGELRHAIPEFYKRLPQNQNDVPNNNLKIKHVFGYRSFGTKNAVKYTSDAKVVFISAGLGVVMENQKKNQTFFSQHDDDVVSMAVHPRGNICATGQRANKGHSKIIPIYVWNIDSKDILAELKGFHVGAIIHLAFSPDGNKLISFGKDMDHSCAIYDWANSRQICSTKVGRDVLTDACFKNDNEFLTVGTRHVKFWTMQGSNLSGVRGRWGNERSEAIVSATFCFPQNVCFTGGVKGKIFTWQGNTCARNIIAHEDQPVRVQLNYKNVLYSGGDDGRVKSWSFSGKLQQQQELVAMKSISQFPPGIRSLDLKHDGTILVATRGSEIYEITSDKKSNLILQGHFDGALWGLAVNPITTKFATCGGDKTVRIWDANTKSMLNSETINEDARAIDWSSNGQLLVVGTVEGNLILFDMNLNELHRISSSFTSKNQWIEDLKISPDCNMIALGAHGGASKIEIQNINNNKLIKKGFITAGLTSALTHLDWSIENGFQVANSQDYELKFCSVNAMKNVASSSAKDIKWYTWTCTLGPSVQGIFSNADGTEVNSVCRSKSEKLMVTGDDFGKVNLFKYPSIAPKSGFRGYGGHSSHVTKVKFLDNDSYVVSTGGEDRTIILWQTDFGNSQGDQVEDEEEEEQINKDEYDEVISVEPKQKRSKHGDKIVGDIEGIEIGTNVQDGMFQDENIKKIDEFMAIKPWLGAIKPPSYFIKPPVGYDHKPKVQINLEYCFGYRAKDCRNNIKYLADGRICYNAAGLGVVLDPDTNKQTFFKNHIDDVTAIAVHPNLKIIATGEIGPKPHIYIWDSNSMLQIAVIRTGVIKGIGSQSFSPNGEKLIVTCIDDCHMTCMYNAQTGTLLCSEKGDTAKVLDSKWKNDTEFVTVGVKHFKHWKVNGNSITSTRGQFGKENSRVQVCVEINGNDVITGAVDGSLVIWKGTSAGKARKLHDGCLDSIVVTDQYILTGAKDCTLNVLTKSYITSLAIDLKKLLPDSVLPKPQAIDMTTDSKTIIIGTLGQEIYQVSTKDLKLNNNTKFQVKEILKSHYAPNLKYTNEVWGLCVLSDGDRFLSCSADGTLRQWSISERKQLNFLSLNIDQSGQTLPVDSQTKDLQTMAKLRCVGVSPDDTIASVGCEDGTLRIIDVTEWQQIKIHKDRNARCTEVKFSPNGKYMACGFEDCYIDIFIVPEMRRIYAMRKHSSYITHIDWSMDSVFLQSNCGGHELLFWDIASGKQLSTGGTVLRNNEWSTWSCVLGWPVQGIWNEKEMDENDINMVDRSHETFYNEYKIIATADDSSNVRLYKYPCLKKGSESVIGKGHSSYVTNVKWCLKDEYLVSTGGEDQCVMLWKVDKE